RLSPRTTEPFSTMPPSRNRLPAGMCFSATITGVEKNTIESRKALSTSAAAMASTASEPPIMVNRRCLRVMRASRAVRCGQASRSSIEPEIFQAFVQLAQPLGVVGDGLAGVGLRALGLVVIAQHHIGAHQPQPS